MLDLFEPPKVRVLPGASVVHAGDDETAAERRQREARELRAERDRRYQQRNRALRNARQRERYRFDAEYRAKKQAEARAFYHALPDHRKAALISQQRAQRAARVSGRSQREVTA